MYHWPCIWVGVSSPQSDLGPAISPVRDVSLFSMESPPLDMHDWTAVQNILV